MPLEHNYIFLLGRPGCGRSVLYRELEKRFLEGGRVASCERVDDFPRLWARILADDALEQQGKERLCSGFTDDGHYLLHLPIPRVLPARRVCGLCVLDDHPDGIQQFFLRKQL